MDPWTIAYIVIALALSIALAPKPPKSRPATLEDFSIPTAEEGRPVPVVFGKVRITGSNILWYGDLKTKKLKKGSLFGSTTIGYEYYMGLHFGLCHGPVDAILALDAGEKSAWTGNLTASTTSLGTTLQVRARSLFGGKKKEGGLYADVLIRMGEASQVADAYLASEIGGTIPAFRGITTLVWRGTIADAILGRTGGYIGNTPYLKPFAWTVKRQLKGWHQDNVWYSAKAAIGDGMNPAHIIYEGITNPEWGMGLPASVIDAANFTAAADALHAEGFGLQLMWTREGMVEDFLQEVVNHISATLAFNRRTGKFELVLLRGGYDPETLPEYGTDKLIDVRSYQRQAWGETCNELTLVYTDPATLKKTGVTTHDLGNIASQGQRIPQKIEYPGIADHGIATKVAERELAARSTPLAKVTIAMDRTAWAHKQGDLIRLTWPQLGISQMVVRIMAGRNGTLTEGTIELEGIEDVFGMPSSTYTDQPPVGGDPDAATYDEEADEVGPSVISATTTAPPGSPADGDTYLIPTGATGAWATHVGEIATWDEDDATWVYAIPVPGTVVTVTSTSTYVQTVAGASPTPYTPIQTTGKVAFTTTIGPSALGADENNYAPTGLDTASTLRLAASGAARTITGLTGGEPGRLLLVHNVGATYDLVLKDESASSTAANRFALNADVTLKPDQSTLLQYDSTSSRWRVIGGTGSGSSSPLTTKGDLYVRNATVDARLPVGANGQVPVADSGEALGIKWADLASGGLADNGAFVTRTGSAQSIANTTDVAVSFDTEVQDDLGYVNISGNPTRLTIPTTGWYIISARVRWDSNGTGGRNVQFRKNGSTYLLSASDNQTANAIDLGQNITAIEYLTAGDYVEVIVRQASGATRTLSNTAEFVPAAAIHRLMAGSGGGGGGGGGSIAYEDRASSFTAASNTGYFLTANDIVVTLPASPANYDAVAVVSGTEVAGCSVARNGKTIMGLAEDMELDGGNFAVKLVYRSATGDWRISA